MRGLTYHATSVLSSIENAWLQKSQRTRITSTPVLRALIIHRNVANVGQRWAVPRWPAP
jgi:hypothetical protein